MAASLMRQEFYAHLADPSDEELRNDDPMQFLVIVVPVGSRCQQSGTENVPVVWNAICGSRGVARR